MGSSRLPGKVLKPIAGRVLLDHVLDRLSLLEFPVKKVVATSDLAQDAAIVQHCLNKRVDVFRGSESDVLDRYYQCARHYSFDHVIRLTADNPFTDIEELRRLIEQHLSDAFVRINFRGQRCSVRELKRYVPLPLGLERRYIDDNSTARVGRFTQTHGQHVFGDSEIFNGSR